MSMRDRMMRASPLWKAMVTRMDALIAGHNELVSIVLGGQNPHKTNDVTNVPAVALATVQSGTDGVIDLEQDLITKYEAHLGSSTHHLAADTTNVVTELGVPVEIYTLLNELKTDYEAHRQLTAGSVHAGVDSTNTISSANATTKASAVTLANELSTDMQANFVNVTSHHGGSGDTAGAAALLALGTLTGSSTWTEIAAVADGIRTNYEAHRVLTAGSVHGGADSTNDVTATAVGTVTTALYAGLNELKGDFNAHIAETGTSHRFSDTEMLVTAANASTAATARTLVNEIRDKYLDHLSRAAEVAAGPLVATLDED